ncbi:MAG TPA: LysR substrate-binding domain-containing protein [Alphaproteobacteria bacterium]|nr:LysR substrate-binding domain-containing protein [Alphaproteobacteria bacterium]
MINTRQVEAFRAVMLTGGMTRAAELMSVTQPAVSRLIRDLQATLGLKLFERRGTRLVATGEAHSLYREVERSFVGIDRIWQAALELRERRAGTLRIASLPALANDFLPRFVGRFLRTRPKLDLALFGLTSRVVLDWVATGQCDLGFAELPIEHPTVTVEPLAPVPAMAVVPARHRLARRRRLQPRDFAGEPFISLGQSTLLRFRIDAVFADAGVRRQMRIETPLAIIACAFAAAEAGLTIVSPFTAEAMAGRGVVVLPFEPRIDVEFGLLHSSQFALSGIAREFADAFRAEVEEFARRRR